MRSSSLVLGTLVWVSVAGLAACGSSGSGGGGGGAGGGGLGGFGGTGGGATGGVAGMGGNAGSGGGSAGMGGSAGSGGATDAGSDAGGTAANHVLISEVGIQPGGAEFIELYNPTAAEVDLSNYYVSDNSAYYKLTSGPWAPNGTPGTDFLARFPAGTKLAAGATLVVASEPAQNNQGYEALFGKCPDFTLNSTATPLPCGSSSVPAMLIPPNGSVGDSKGALLSNEREMVVLFEWDGAATTVVDVDYVTWGSTFDNDTRIDKTGLTGYVADTPRSSQKGAVVGVAPEGGANWSISRCALEPAETLTGGNGQTGHDETSEDMTAAFQAGSPTPGTKNPCLP